MIRPPLRRSYILASLPMSRSAPSAPPLRPARPPLSVRALRRRPRRPAGARARLAGLAAPALVAVALAGCGSSGAAVAGQADSQIAFGVQMAQRGLWSEALFRFQQAERLAPGDFRVMNNLAVAYEANGDFDRALSYYQRALSAQPDNRELRRNYSRFAEFYNSFRPREEGAPEGAAEQPAPPPEGGSAGADAVR